MIQVKGIQRLAALRPLVLDPFSAGTYGDETPEAPTVIDEP